MGGYRAGHGRGAGVPRIEIVPDELPKALPQRTVSGTPDRGPDGRFGVGNGAAAKPHLSLTRVASLEAGESTTDPVYRRFLRAAGAYRRARCRELAKLAGGYLGAGVSSLVASAAYGLADARYLRHLAMGEPVPKERAALLVQAGRLEQHAKGHELASYELAIREAQARKDAPVDPSTWAAAWAEAGKPAEVPK